MKVPEQNPFESGARKVIPAVLVYLRTGTHAESKILMIHRVDSAGTDFHSGKWNGLGGKCELDESPPQTAKRETLEEAGIELNESEFIPLGVLQFPNFKPAQLGLPDSPGSKRACGEDWIVFVFTANVPEDRLAEIKKTCDEGELHWKDVSELESLNVWPGDRHFLSYVKAGTPFMGTIWYTNGAVTRHWVTRI